MGRHSLPPARPRHAAGRPGPGRATLGRRITVPATVAAALLAGAPAGTALAADAAPPGGVDVLGSALGTVIGTDRGPGQASPTATADSLIGAAGVLPDTTTRVVLQEKNDSNVSGRATITNDRVVAQATGMDPTARYVSFFYGATSSATNNNPCILDGTNPLPGNQTVGEWRVDRLGNGSLSAPNPLGARYTLQAGTMSIRKVQHDFSKATALPVNPASYSLVACGEVRRIAVLDPVTGMVPKLPKLPSIRPVS